MFCSQAIMMNHWFQELKLFLNMLERVSLGESWGHGINSSRVSKGSVGRKKENQN